ncbi:MAG: symmetrical bis(5'-nucleosyl)-tetraphosphatase [Methylococcaceae bacterium]|nr:symmetrical bis(5'-nucleosyl)-tetraphosphatase [Methylococcaceae bacterium]
MATYAIGDIQGCYDDLLRLLDVINFDPDKDTLWFAGDLVNRGAKSLETLRFVKGLGDKAVSVLGNHDLHLLAIAFLNKKSKKKDTLNGILNAPDRDELLDWLRKRPVFHYNNDYCLLHAGLPPQWNFAQTKAMAVLLEQALQGDNHIDFFKAMYGDLPNIWSDDLQGLERLRFILNCFTRLRYCDAQGHLDFNHKDKPSTQPAHLQPWFTVESRKSVDMKIIFGHWSTLGFYEGNNCYGIDTGCLWGGQLTALKLGDKAKRISIDCAGVRKPK